MILHYDGLRSEPSIKYLTRMHSSSRMRTVRFSCRLWRGVSAQGKGVSAQGVSTTPPLADPLGRHPCAPLHAGIHLLPTASWDTPPPPPVNRMTDRCKNITLSQTSFTAGKYNTHKLDSVLLIHFQLSTVLFI